MPATFIKKGPAFLIRNKVVCRDLESEEIQIAIQLTVTCIATNH